MDEFLSLAFLFCVMTIIAVVFQPEALVYVIFGLLLIGVAVATLFAVAKAWQYAKYLINEMRDDR